MKIWYFVNNCLIKARIKKIILHMCDTYNRQVEQKPGGRGRGRKWATLGVHPLSWLLSNNRIEMVPFVSVPHTSSNRLLLSNQNKGCTPCVAHSLTLPLGPALLNLWNYNYLKHSTFRFNFIDFQLYIDFPFQFCVFTVKSPSVTQRSVSQENAYKKSLNPSPFLHKTIGSDNSFTLISGF